MVLMVIKEALLSFWGTEGEVRMVFVFQDKDGMLYAARSIKALSTELKIKPSTLKTMVEMGVITERKDMKLSDYLKQHKKPTTRTKCMLTYDVQYQKDEVEKQMMKESKALAKEAKVAKAEAVNQSEESESEVEEPKHASPKKKAKVPPGLHKVAKAVEKVHQKELSDSDKEIARLKKGVEKEKEKQKRIKCRLKKNKVQARGVK